MTLVKNGYLNYEDFCILLKDCRYENYNKSINHYMRLARERVTELKALYPKAEKELANYYLEIDYEKTQIEVAEMANMRWIFYYANIIEASRNAL